MKFKKKGIFFTFIAVLMLGAIIFFLTPKSEPEIKKNDITNKARIESVDKIVSALSGSLTKTIVDATVYRALLSMTLYINKTGKYLDKENFNKYVSDIMYNGTLNGSSIDTLTGQKIMENNTFKNWTERVSTIINSTYKVALTGYKINTTIAQIQPWQIQAFIVVNYSIVSETATWTGPTELTSRIEIEGMIDPYYLRESNGLIPRIVRQDNRQFFQWSITSLRKAIRNSTYIHWPDSKAPSFLMRFVNQTGNSSCCGIESVVNPNELTTPDRLVSYVDYHFFSGHFTSLNCSVLYNITNPGGSIGLWDEFPYIKLDYKSTVWYNISALDRKLAC